MSSLPTAAQRFINGIIPENPIYRLLLGMCPTLAVTNNMQAALTMAGATTFVLICSNIMISLIRKLLQPHLRILVFTLTIATFVTVVDRLLAAHMFEMSKQLGPYIPLIIVNCIIISRCEVCAAVQGPFVSAMDALGVGVGFTLGLASIATVREILGSGTWFGLTVLPPEVWTPWSIMILPPGAFLTLGVLLALFNFIQARLESR
ncbi:MAG: electron transport complex subunit RsxE [Planctomycetaceae bacterium]|nr:electron transport complex subunit RsxE [Planctomycetaceae bacterium]